MLEPTAAGIQETGDLCWRYSICRNFPQNCGYQCSSFRIVTLVISQAFNRKHLHSLSISIIVPKLLLRYLRKPLESDRRIWTSIKVSIKVMLLPMNFFKKLHSIFFSSYFKHKSCLCVTQTHNSYTYPFVGNTFKKKKKKDKLWEWRPWSKCHFSNFPTAFIFLNTTTPIGAFLSFRYALGKKSRSFCGFWRNGILLQKSIENMNFWRGNSSCNLNTFYT